jgi:hypothetical protein
VRDTLRPFSDRLMNKPPISRVIRLGDAGELDKSADIAVIS